jgi:hypothetical protein
LWLSTPEIVHYSFLLDVWANPDSTIMDLIKQIGVSESTVDYYVGRMSADWSVRRHARLTSNIKKTDPFNSFLHAVECNRLNDYRVEAVNSKISEKLEGGHYGQISDALYQTLPADIQNHPDNFLNKDTCDYERFTDKVIADAAVVVVSPCQPVIHGLHIINLPGLLKASTHTSHLVSMTPSQTQLILPLLRELLGTLGLSVSLTTQTFYPMMEVMTSLSATMMTTKHLLFLLLLVGSLILVPNLLNTLKGL